jgi:hypothetical protein
MRFEILGSVPGIFAHSTLLRKGFARASPAKTIFDRAALVRLGGRARLRVLADSIRTGLFVSRVSRGKGRGTALDRRGWVWPVCAL